MKIVIYLAFILVAATCDETSEKLFDKDEEECIVELSLERAEMAKLNKLDLPPDSNTDFNKFVECNSKKKGLMTFNGEILFSQLKKLYLEVPDVKKLSKIVYYAYEVVISQILSRCENQSIDGAEPGKNMILVQRCVHNEFVNLKRLMSNDSPIPQKPSPFPI